MYFKANNENIPSIDNDTRWSSCFKMLESLSNCKVTISQLANIGNVIFEKMNDKEFDDLKDLVRVLRDPAKLTLELQSETLTPGEFVKLWKLLINRLEKLTSPLATELSSSLRLREDQLFNSMLKAATKLDPRYTLAITDDDDEEVKKYLLSRVSKLKGLFI